MTPPVSGSVTPDTASWRHAWPWLLLALGLGAHFLLFRAFVQREVAWGYPRLWDQAGVLSSTYVLRHILREHGLAHGLGLSVPWLPPQGVALPFEAALLMLVAKPARWLALAVVWLHLAGLAGLPGGHAARPVTWRLVAGGAGAGARAQRRELA